MKKIMIVAALIGMVLGGVYTNAQINQAIRSDMVDYACVNDCTAKGYSWMYCQRICSY